MKCFAFVRLFVYPVIIMTMDLQKLTQLRDEIDRIDDEIHQLIMERSELAMQIGQSKGVLDRTAIRPAREAFIHRRLFERHGGVFPYDALMRMWREMINGFTLLQSQYALAVLWSDSHTRCWDLARDQFGTRVHIDTCASEHAVLQSVLATNFVIGVLPRPPAVSSPAESNLHPWWVELSHLSKKLGDDAPRILFRLPYAGMCQSPPLEGTIEGTIEGIGPKINTQQDDAYAIAPIPFEKTGLDVSVVVLKLSAVMEGIDPCTDGGADGGADGLLETLSTHFNCDVQLVAMSDCGHYAMAEIYEYLTSDDSRLQGIDGVATATCIGGYADMTLINQALLEDEQNTI